MDIKSVLLVPYDSTPETDSMPMNRWERLLSFLFPPEPSFATRWREFANSNLRYVFDVRKKK